MKLTVLILSTFVIVVSESFATNAGGRRIPMQMRMRMKDVKSTSDFIHSMVENKAPSGVELEPMARNMFPQNAQTQQGFNREAVELMAAAIAEPDVCEPRPTTVPIPPDEDPRIVYWPTCTKVDRCGGCCGLDLLECAPTAVETMIVQVMKQRMSANDSSRFEYLGNVNIPLEKHLHCDCHCRTKATDCNSATQDYEEESCSCRCRNSHEATSCPSPKRWDEKYCRCVCPVLVNCLDDEYYDFNTCSCVRGTPMVAVNGGVSLASDSQCVNVPCRAGYRARLVNSRCQCTRSKR